jgi:hypothetical protein
MTMRELLSEEYVCGFIGWSKQRNVKTVSLTVGLSMLLRALRRYGWKEESLKWLKEAIRELPKDDASMLDERDRAKWVDYDRLATIPDQIRAAAERLLERGTKRYSQAMRDALLIQWLVTLPWRQRNVREMRIGRRDEGPTSSWPASATNLLLRGRLGSKRL